MRIGAPVAPIRMKNLSIAYDTFPRYLRLSLYKYRLICCRGPGRGSEFVVRLPASSETRAPSKPGIYGPSSQAKQAGRRILVVDDNPDNAHIIRDYLEARGYPITVAYNGDDALKAFGEVKPALVLLDVFGHLVEGLR